MAGKVQQQHVFSPAVGEEIFDPGFDFMRRLVADDLDVEVADRAVA
jgi:hypothetical protein